MAPDVTNWILFGAIALTVVWIGFLIMAVRWALNNATVLIGVVVAIGLGSIAVNEYRRTH